MPPPAAGIKSAPADTTALLLQPGCARTFALRMRQTGAR